MTTDLIAFLRARLEELADAAREEIEYRKSLPDLTGASVVIPPLMWVGWDDPTFVLADVGAKRRIIDRYVSMDEEASDPCESCWAQGLGEVLRLLALPYDRHPDYQKEWVL